MLDFFVTKNHTVRTSTKQFVNFDYVKRRYRRDINRIIMYYRGRERTIDNKNIFSRLIHMLSPDINLDITTYFKYVDANARYMARQFKLVNNISKGTVFENIFYTDDSYAIINHVDTDFDIFDIEHNWINRTPLRVTYTNETDIDFYFLDRRKRPRDTILTVVELDINLMLMMYREWCKMRLRNERSTNPNVFVYKVVLPNTIMSSIDLVVFNRFKSIYYGDDIKDFTVKHPIITLNFTKKLDNILTDTCKFLTSTGRLVEDMLRTIPTIASDNMLDVLYINRPIYTRQSEWSIWMSRLKYIVFLIDLMGERGVSMNRSVLYHLPRKIKELENRSTDIWSILPTVLLNDFNADIEKIKTKIGRR